MRKNHKKQANYLRPILLTLIVLMAAAVIGVMLLSQDIISLPEPDQSQPTPSADATASTETGDTPPQTATDPSGIDLGQGLWITDLYNYSGIYMEDGTNDPVMDVMMLTLRNSGGADLQYLELELRFDGQLYAFQATNVAAGNTVVLLERNRQAYPGGQPEETAVRHLALFPEPMELHEDKLRISGMDGALNVENISDRDIAGDIYVYYKYAGSDVLYGGITFRAKVPGLKTGELYQVPTGHYSPESCVIVQVTMVD